MDISQLAHRGGVATYIRNLTTQLSKNSDLQTIYFYSSLRRSYKGRLKNVKKYRLPPTLFEMLFNRWRNVSIERFLGPMDIFHSSDWTQPPAKAKKITTYHDLVPIKFPQWSYPKIVEVQKRRLRIVEREVDLVIAVSESAKNDLLEVSQIPQDKVVVIYEAPTANFKPQPKDKIRKFKQKYHLPNKFVLAIGGIGERRNLQRIRQACKDYNLIISGMTIPWLDDTEDLELLYCSAEVLLYASLYEGFGIPILDAMMCGLPVITSNVSSMPEIGGNAPLYVDPFDVSDIKDKLNEIMTNDKLREGLIKNGFDRVKEFSWEKCADETFKVYTRLVNKS